MINDMGKTYSPCASCGIGGKEHKTSNPKAGTHIKESYDELGYGFERKNPSMDSILLLYDRYRQTG